MRLLIGLVLAMGGGCQERGEVEEPAWPAWPTDDAAIAQLIAAHTRRPASAGPFALDPETFATLVRQRLRAGRASCGWPAIVARLRAELDTAAAAGRDGYLLWGTFHDSPAQVEAFRRVIGPLGVGAFSAVVVEAFSADGRWTRAGAAEQRGDSASLARYLSTGAPDAWNRLVAGQREHNYTAFKYAYLPAILDLLVTARATGQPLLGCDLPEGLRRRVSSLDEAGRTRLRELHCWLATERDSTGSSSPRRVAMLWGMDHVAPHGFPRFLRGGDFVLPVYLFGGRGSRVAPERRLAESLRVTAPLLIPLTDPQPGWVLLLPNAGDSFQVERKRHRLDAAAPPELAGRVVAHSTGGGELRLGAQEISLAPRPQAIAVPPTTSCLALTSSAGELVSELVVPAEGYLELMLDPEEAYLVVTSHEQKSAHPALER